jgi:hypothetical protein
MRITKLSVLTAAIAALGLMGALTAASASADTITCQISGSIKLSPGLTETPTVQNVGITAHKGAKLTSCSGTETMVTGGSIHVVAKTKEAITCKALKESGAALESTNDAIFKWTPRGGPNSTGSLNVPITEMAAGLEGSVAIGEFPFSEDKISGSVTETYGGGATCGSSGGHGHGGGKKVNKGTFAGSITIS